MEFPTPAVLVFAWFLLTPVIRIGLWLFVRNWGRRMRLFVAHGSSFVIMVAASAIVLSGNEIGGMAVMLGVGQLAFFAIDFWNVGADRPAA